MLLRIIRKNVLLLSALVIVSFMLPSGKWESKFIKLNKDGSLNYIPDEKGNIIPDFSRVGFYNNDVSIPDIAVVKTVTPTGTDDDETTIQAAIDEVASKPLDKNGYRGTVLLKKGTYKIPES